MTSLSYYREESTYLVVASNWGKETHPDWFYNLMQYPQTTIQVEPDKIQVEAHQAQGEEYTRFKEVVIRQNSQFLQYQRGVLRQIPILVLASINFG